MLCDFKEKLQTGSRINLNPFPYPIRSDPVKKT